MGSNILVIVEFGAQKQRISLNPTHSYKDICNQIYSLFKLDINKSKYMLQRQDPFKPDLFTNIDEHSLMDDLQHYATNSIRSPMIRLRLMPTGAKSFKATNGFTNGEKAWSTSSQCLPDESDRASTTSAVTIDIKQLIKKCLSNLKETTDNIQLLDRYLHPEDYLDEDSKSTSKLSMNNSEPSMPMNILEQRQISQISSVSDSRLPSSNIIDELVPALNQLINIQPPSSASSVSKPIEPIVAPPPTINYPPMSTSTPPPSNNPLRPTNKSFSNRLGMIMSSNQSPSSVVQQSKPPSSSAHQYPPPKPKSPPVVVKQSAIPSLMTTANESCKNTVSPPSLIPKCAIELKQYEPGTIIEGIVSVAFNASYFFLQVLDQRRDEFDHLSKSLYEYYSNLDKNSHYRPLPGHYCVAMYTEDARWYRARIIRYLSDQTCEVFYVDYGNMEELPIDLVHEILPEFTRLPARAIACTIAEILPPTGQEGWTKRATYAFASRCGTNERVQANVIDSTNMKWPMHMVRLRVSKTQEDVGASLENCKVARHASNDEICQFWSNKIRPEQYILYNLQEPTVHRFPLIEQVSETNANEQRTKIFLSSTSTDSSTKEDVPNASKENVNETISTIIPEEKLHPIEQSTPDLSEEQKDKISITPSSSSGLNPEATPFFVEPTNGEIEHAGSVSTGNETDDECDSDGTPATPNSFERPRVPIKEEVIVDTSLMPTTPLVKSWLPVEVTNIETPTRFYIRYIYGPGWNLGNAQTPQLVEKKDLPEKNVVLNQITQEMTECYSKHKRVSPGDSYDDGELVAVKSRSRWHRGRFIQYKPEIDFAHIFFVDYGHIRALPIQMIRSINNRFALHAEQAHLVHLHQPGQRRSRIEWTKNVIEEFREMTREGTNLYARIINEPNTIDLMSYDSLTKKWFSFYEHFVKHLNDNEQTEQDT